jgi:DNA primase
MTRLDIQEIKNRLDLKSVMTHYGLQFNRAGFCCCPFHNEKTGSLSVKGQFYKCFGCGASGDVFSFVQHYFGLGFAESVAKLDCDFHIGIAGKRAYTRSEREAEASRVKEIQAQKEALHKRQSEYMKKTHLHCYYVWCIKHLQPRTAEEFENPDMRWVEAIKNIGYLDYWFSEHDWERG